MFLKTRSLMSVCSEIRLNCRNMMMSSLLATSDFPQTMELCTELPSCKPTLHWETMEPAFPFQVLTMLEFLANSAS